MGGWVGQPTDRTPALTNERTGERGGNRRTDKNINTLEDGSLNE